MRPKLGDVECPLTMRSISRSRDIRLASQSAAIAFKEIQMRVERGTLFLIGIISVGWALSGCAAPSKLSAAELASADVRVGAIYWHAEQGLDQRGYSCYVSGANRESFDCTRSVGFWQSCIQRITFVVDENNLVASLVVHDPACLGTP